MLTDVGQMVNALRAPYGAQYASMNVTNSPEEIMNAVEGRSGIQTRGGPFPQQQLLPSPEPKPLLTRQPPQSGLNLRRIENPMPGEQSFDFINPKNERVGGADIGYDPIERRVHILGINSDLPSPLGNNSAAVALNEQAHSLGTANIKSLIRAVPCEYPDMKEIVGIRDSGIKSRQPITGWDSVNVGRREAPTSIVNLKR